MSGNVDAGIRATALAIAWSMRRLPAPEILLEQLGEDLVVVPSDVLGEQPRERGGIAPELAVRKGSLLERSERLHPLVRLPEQPQPQNAEDDHEQGGADERDEQLGVDAGGQPSDRPDERVVGRAQQPALSRRRLLSPAAGPRSCDKCSDLQL